MPKKSSRYPPIHDQIDTPTDFSMAERQWQQRRWKQVTERSRAEMSDAGSEVGGKRQHKPATERAGKPEFSTQPLMPDSDSLSTRSL